MKDILVISETLTIELVVSESLTIKLVVSESLTNRIIHCCLLGHESSISKEGLGCHLRQWFALFPFGQDVLISAKLVSWCEIWYAFGYEVHVLGKFSQLRATSS